MSNFNTPWFVEGALHSAQVARNVTYAATGGKQGIVKEADCQVLELTTPGGSVRVTPGTVAALGNGLADETYVGRLPIEDEVAITATDSAGGRSDLVVVRIVNPAYEAAPADWPAIDPDNGPFAQTYVYEGVPAGTTDLTEVDPGATGVTLARIDLPASTGTVTQGMIVDLRPAPLSGSYLSADGGTMNGTLLISPDDGTWGAGLHLRHPAPSGPEYDKRHMIWTSNMGQGYWSVDTTGNAEPDYYILQGDYNGMMNAPAINGVMQGTDVDKYGTNGIGSSEVNLYGASAVSIPYDHLGGINYVFEVIVVWEHNGDGSSPSYETRLVWDSQDGAGETLNEISSNTIQGENGGTTTQVFWVEFNSFDTYMNLSVRARCTSGTADARWHASRIYPQG